MPYPRHSNRLPAQSPRYIHAVRWRDKDCEFKGDGGEVVSLPKLLINNLSTTLIELLTCFYSSIIFPSMIAPFLPLLLTLSLICLHFRHSGISNRDGIIGAFLVIITSAYCMCGDAVIESDERGDEW